MNLMQSFAMSMIGSHCTIQILDSWAKVSDPKKKSYYLIASAIAFSGCGVWSAHFIGSDESGELYDGILLILAWIQCVFSTIAAATIAAKDPYFTISRTEIVQQIMIRSGSSAAPVQMASLIAKLHFIIIGGVVAGLGVFILMCLALKSQHTQVDLKWNAYRLLLSAFVTCIVSVSSFWVIFRVSTFYPNDRLKVLSSLLLALSVCVSHHSVVSAVTYHPKVHGSLIFALDEHLIRQIATQGGVLLSYILIAVFGIRIKPKKRRRSSIRLRTRPLAKKPMAQRPEQARSCHVMVHRSINSFIEGEEESEMVHPTRRLMRRLTMEGIVPEEVIT